MFTGMKLFILCKRSCHVYKAKYVPSSEIAEKLTQNIIHFKDGLLVLNKPYGISFSADTTKVKDPLEVSLSTIVPFLKKSLGITDLYNVKVPEKYVSGIAIFSTEKSVQEKLHKYLLLMRWEKQPSHTYESIVIGTPTLNKSYFDGNIVLENSPTTNEKKTALVPSSSKTERRKGLAKKVVITHRTLSQSTNNASLVEIASTRSSWNCIRTYLSTVLLSPILGDNIYGSCVKNVLGQTILIDKFSPAAGLPQKIPSVILNKIRVKCDKDITVPLHLHLANVVIRCHDTKTLLEFSASPPQSFIWSSQQLGLI